MFARLQLQISSLIDPASSSCSALYIIDASQRSTLQLRAGVVTKADFPRGPNSSEISNTQQLSALPITQTWPISKHISHGPGKVLSCYKYLKMVAGSGTGQGTCNPLMTPESPSSNTSQGGWEIYELLVKTILL